MGKKLSIDKDSQLYLSYRYATAFFEKLLYYFFGLLKIKNNKIVIGSMYGMAGYSCHVKYICEELINAMENENDFNKYEIIWLTNREDAVFPKNIKVKKYNLVSRAYHLSTSRIWIDSHRKLLETRKRKGQLYIQTWHGPIGFKATGRQRPADKFLKIAAIVNENDSKLADYFISNSNWNTNHYRTGFDYFGDVLKVGSPRMDGIINKRSVGRLKEICNVSEDTKICMYAPTLRGGDIRDSSIIRDADGSIDYNNILNKLSEKFGGKWHMVVKRHPAVAKQSEPITIKNCTDISNIADVYEVLGDVDFFISDYSSLAFDACYTKIPVLLYSEDFEEYGDTRGLLWKLEDLPFPIAKDEETLLVAIDNFEYGTYCAELDVLFENIDLLEDGQASVRIRNVIDDFIKNKHKTNNEFIDKFKY